MKREHIVCRVSWGSSHCDNVKIIIKRLLRLSGINVSFDVNDAINCYISYVDYVPNRVDIFERT